MSDTTTEANDETTAALPGDDLREATFAEVADRADRLAAALARLGVEPGHLHLPRRFLAETALRQRHRRPLRRAHPQHG